MNTKTIKINKDNKTGVYFFKLTDFSDLFDISKIVSYQIKKSKNGQIKLMFFDENDQLIKPNQQKEG